MHHSVSENSYAIEIKIVEASHNPSPTQVIEFGLTIREPNGRLAYVDFSKSEQSKFNYSHAEKFHELLWVFHGAGLLFHKGVTSLSNPSNSFYGVVALWPVIENDSATFAQLAQDNARTSVETEEGCLLFGVFQSVSKPNVFSLVEVFQDAEYFDKHLETAHFKEFAKHARPIYLGDRAQTVKGATKWM